LVVSFSLQYKREVEKVRIGYDLDGVLCDIDVAVIRIMDNLPKVQRDSVEEWYYRDRKPRLNPYLFGLPEDEVFIITGRQQQLKDITTTWVTKHFPDIIKSGRFFIVGAENDTLNGVNDKDEIEKWCQRRIKEKADMINKLKLDVYFDDNVFIQDLRELCPSCKIIHFGGRV